MSQRLKHIFGSTLAALLLLALGGCTPQYQTFEGTALGTLFRITAGGRITPTLRAELTTLFDEANKEMSVFDDNSLLSRINRGETDSLSANIIYCIEMAHRVSELSGGAYDITIQPLVEAYGFSGDDPDFTPNLDSLLPLVDYRKIEVVEGRLVRPAGVQIGLNSIAKGAVVDMAAALLEEAGFEDYMVDIGGEIFCRGKSPSGRDWRIGVETPFEGNFSLTGEYIEAVLSLSGAGMATSGNYRNFHTDAEGRKLTHIIDPHTGANTESNLLSATVIAENCALADAYGTMLMALGYDDALALVERESIPALLIWADDTGEMQITMTDEMKPHLE
ncbi:MAG: FAD:protein FMN transferase [Tidjanibacter sp.]|nr:FAD:protein FMN transferase [Tidjanibacter sp.]